MCRTFTIFHALFPCNERCTGHLTPRVKPCSDRGTVLCRIRSSKPKGIPYNCPKHLQLAFYPVIQQYVDFVTIYRHGIYPNTTFKYDELDDSVKPHVKQWAFNAFLALRAEYHEAIRESIMMAIDKHHDLEQRPKAHVEITKAYQERLEDALTWYTRAEFLKTGVHKDRQPEVARFFFSYNVVDEETFEQRMRAIKEGTSDEFDVPFSDVVDRATCDTRSEDDDDETSDRALGDEVGQASGHEPHARDEGLHQQGDQGGPSTSKN